MTLMLHDHCYYIADVPLTITALITTTADEHKLYMKHFWGKNCKLYENYSEMASRMVTITLCVKTY